MPLPTDALPAEVLAALKSGDTIGAIKMLRQSHGLGLKEAKDLIDAQLHGVPVRIGSPVEKNPLPPDVREALQRGEKIEAIKLLREQTGMGLKEAKDAIDTHPMETSSSGATLAPGEVRKSGSATAWVLALIVVALAAYYFLRAPA